MRKSTGLMAASMLFGCLLAVPAAAQDMVLDHQGWYFKGELGGQMLASDFGYWWGPGGPPADPRITFSLNDAMAVTGSFGAGYDWGNGVRFGADVGLMTGMQVEGRFASASDGTTVGHATDIHAAVSAASLFGNLYVEPLRLAGVESSVQPFLTAGVGVANVSVGNWTRNNAASPQPTRTWSGDSRVNLAWQVGGGVSVSLEEWLGHAGFIDLTYRYTDLGQASGGYSAVNPPPSNAPTEPFNFRLTAHTATIGLRLPIGSD